MISAAPLKRLLIERDISVDFLSQITGIDMTTLKLMFSGKSITSRNINILCTTLQVQPSEIIEYSQSGTKGYWVYVEEK